jgi:galactosamine-6-phosphate isomerase
MIRPDVFADHEAMSRHAAEWLVARLREQPAGLFCLASGSTPTRTYSLLAAHYVTEPALFSEIRVVKLDEWGGLAADDPASCEYHLRRTLIDPLGLGARYVSFNGQAADPQAECARIADLLAVNGPIDTCVLGLGINGHLGFNEPAGELQPDAHVAKLSEASLKHGMLASARSSPTFGLTLGMADLLQARQVLLLVSGGAKAAPMRRLLEGRITTHFPASLLGLHSQVKLYCDAEAYGAGH